VKLQFIIALTLRSRSGEIRAELNNTPKPILEKGTTQIKAGFVTNLAHTGRGRKLNGRTFSRRPYRRGRTV